jgi:hypothetical protein
LAALLLPAVAAAALLAPGAGQAQNSSAIGSGSGSSAEARCPAGQAINIASIFADDDVRGVQAFCHLKNADGSDASGSSQTSRIGHGGGFVQASAPCPSGTVVSGLEGSGSSVLSGLSIVCRPLSATGGVTGTETILPLRGLHDLRMWPEGNPRGNRVNCPDNRAAVGLFGSANSTHVTRIGLLCDRELDLSAPVITSITLEPASVVGGTQSTATIRLNRQAPTAGTSVSLSVGPSLAAQLAANPVTIPGGNSIGTVRVNTTGVASATNVTVQASAGGVSRQATLTINAPRLASLTFNNESNLRVTGGAVVNARALLNGALPPAGFTVQMNNSAPPVTGLASTFPLTFNPGDPVGQRNFQITTARVHSDVTVTMGAGAVTTSFTVLAPRVQSLAISPMIVAPGAAATATATLTGPAAATNPTSPNSQITAVTTASGSPAYASVGGLANVLAGSASVSFPVTGSAKVTIAACSSISASLNGSTQRSFIGVAAGQTSFIGFGSDVVTVPMFQSRTITLENRSPASVSYGLSASSNAVSLSTSQLDRVPGLRRADFTVTGNQEGCAMVTATAGTQQRSVLVIVTPADVGG